MRFNYLDLYEQQMEDRRRVMDEYKRQQESNEKSIDSKKPAFF